MLIMQSALQWRKHEGHYRDDITAYVIYLPPVVEALRNELNPEKGVTTPRSDADSTAP